MDNIEITKITAPTDWKANLQWFEDTPEDVRAEYARTFCRKVFSWQGQACVIVSYPRANGRIAFYDMDGGEMHWMLLSDARVGGEFEKDYRDSEETDFEWSVILDSLIVDEAGDIARLLFEEG